MLKSFLLFMEIIWKGHCIKLRHDLKHNLTLTFLNHLTIHKPIFKPMESYLAVVHSQRGGLSISFPLRHCLACSTHSKQSLSHLPLQLSFTHCTTN